MAVRGSTIDYFHESPTIRRSTAPSRPGYRRTLGKILFMLALLVFAGSMAALRVIMTTPGLSLH